MPDDEKGKANDLSAAFHDVEIFRTGDYGYKGKFGRKDLDAMAQGYNPAQHEAPVTLDHAQEGPAAGWVEKIERRGNSIFARLTGMATDLMEAVKAGRYKTRSIEVWHDPVGLRAVTFLGAGVPHVKGMRKIAFSDDGADGKYDSFDFDAESAEDLQETKSEAGQAFPAEAFAYVPDAEDSSGWRLRLWENTEDKVTRTQLGRAAAAFSPQGFHGRRTEVPSNAVAGVKRTIRSAYRSIGVPEDEIPAAVKMNESVVVIDGKPLPRGAFALALDENDPTTWALRTWEDKDSGPTKERLGQAVAHYTPGGFGEQHAKVAEMCKDADLARYAAAQLATDYEALGETVPEWIEKAVTAGQAINLSEIDLETFTRARPDIVQEIQEQHEETIMADKEEALQADLDVATKERDEFKAALDTKDGEVAELTAKVDAFEADKAKAEMSQKIEDAIANAELPDDAKTKLREQFADAETDEGVAGAIENVALGMTFAEEKGGEVKGMGDDEGTPDLNDRSQLDAAAKEKAAKDGTSYTDALRSLGPKKS